MKYIGFALTSLLLSFSTNTFSREIENSEQLINGFRQSKRYESIKIDFETTQTFNGKFYGHRTGTFITDGQRYYIEGDLMLAGQDGNNKDPRKAIYSWNGSEFRTFVTGKNNGTIKAKPDSIPNIGVIPSSLLGLNSSGERFFEDSTDSAKWILEKDNAKYVLKRTSVHPTREYTSLRIYENGSQESISLIRDTVLDQEKNATFVLKDIQVKETGNWDGMTFPRVVELQVSENLNPKEFSSKTYSSPKVEFSVTNLRINNNDDLSSLTQGIQFPKHSSVYDYINDKSLVSGKPNDERLEKRELDTDSAREQ